MNKELQLIQSELKAPKNQYNKFGNYNYRNAEDILEALKPLLKKHDVEFRIHDEVIQVGDRYYIKATGIFESASGIIETSAFAREPDNKKGSDDSMITGATSSYARKYMLNGLFLIDDTKDSDSEEGIKEAAAKAEIEDRTRLRVGVQTAPVDEMLQVVSEYLESTKQLEKTLKAYKIERVADMTEPQLIAAYNVAIKTSNKGE